MSVDEDIDDATLCTGFSIPNCLLFGDIRVVGSLAELPPMLHSNDRTSADIDIMFADCNAVALPVGHPYDGQHATVADICTDDINPGFARLRCRQSGEFLTKHRMSVNGCIDLPTAMREYAVRQLPSHVLHLRVSVPIIVDAAGDVPV